MPRTAASQHRARARRVAFAFALGAAGLLAGTLARGQPAAGALAPPRLASSVQPAYPDGAEGDASVLLAVTVGADGSVRDLRVLEGTEPFAAAALRAVGAARFSPATRDGQPVAATIRFRVDFSKPRRSPPPPPAEPPTSEASSPDRGAAPTDEGPREVRVRGGRAAMRGGAAESLARAEVRQLPGAFGDPFRAVEVAPGLAPVLTGLPYFYVRGAPPGNVGYYFDGVRVPYLFHFGLGPAVVHPALVAKTDIYKGGYPAAFGRWAGGVVDSAAMPPADRAHAEGQLRLIDAGALAETPLWNGRASALASARWSYTAALFSLLASDTELDYRDYQARFSYALGPRDTLSLFAFGAYDLAAQRERVDPSAVGRVGPEPAEPREIRRVLFASEFHRVDARWDHALDGGGARVALTAGFDRTRVEARRAAEDVMTAARAELSKRLGAGATLRAGADLIVDRYRGDALTAFSDDDDVVARQVRIFTPRVDYATGVRADVVLTPTRGVEVTPGLRFDAYGSGSARAFGVDPRLAASFAVSDRVRIVHAYGLVTQPPSTPVALPAITVARLEGGLQRSVQSSAGVEIDLPADLTFAGGAFHHAFYGLNDALGTAQVELIDIERSDALLAKSRGNAYGLELGLRRKLTTRVGGFLGYTLSRSMRTAEGRRFVSAYDRPHVMNAALSVDLGRGWRAGSRLVVYSGVPVAGARPAFDGQVVGAPPERTPTFVRVDLRLEKRWRIGERGFVAFVVEALNATLSREVTGYRCGTALALPGSAPAPACTERVVGPVSVPSIGVEGGL